MPKERIYHAELDREIDVEVGLLGLSPAYLSMGFVPVAQTPAEPAFTEPATEPDDNKE